MFELHAKQKWNYHNLQNVTFKQTFYCIYCTLPNPDVLLYFDKPLFHLTFDVLIVIGIFSFFPILKHGKSKIVLF